MKWSGRMSLVLAIVGTLFGVAPAAKAQEKRPNIVVQAQAPAGVPVIKFTKEDSSIMFNVKASVPIEGTFDKWDATATMTSPDVESGVLDIKIQAASVNTGSGMKDGKLKAKTFSTPSTIR
jgi:polyisoprenoid-binding protein YceI